MRGEHKFLCSFCSSCVLRETSMMVDYTDFEEERLREKKVFVCFHHYITGGPPQREEVLREIKMKRFLNFYYATMKFFERTT